jgi:hypothetical protein
MKTEVRRKKKYIWSWKILQWSKNYVNCRVNRTTISKFGKERTQEHTNTHSQRAWLSQKHTVLHFLGKSRPVKTCEDKKLIEFLLRRRHLKNRRKEKYCNECQIWVRNSGIQIWILCGKQEIDQSPRYRKLSASTVVHPALLENSPELDILYNFYTPVNALLMLTHREFIQLSGISN